MNRPNIGYLAALVLLSIVLGSVSGTVAGLAMGFGSGWPFAAAYGGVAAAFGGAVGLLWSPTFLWALAPGRVALGVVCISAPTCIAAVVSGMLSSLSGNPFVPMVVAGAIYVIASILFGVWSRMHPLPVLVSDGCLECGYCLTGNATGVCPECGTHFRVSAVHAVPPKIGASGDEVQS